MKDIFKNYISWHALASAADAMRTFLLCAVLAVGVAAIILGCTGKSKPVAKAAPEQAMVSPEDFAPEGFQPDFVCLRPGQTAELLEDVEVEARIPYNGDSGSGELWMGRVRIEKGTMLVKPAAEQ